MVAGNSDLIGRNRELSSLRSALDTAQAGSGGVLLVAGETGVGKTSLVRAAMEGWDRNVLWTRADQGATPPFGPLLAVLRQHLRAGQDGFEDLGPLVPYLARLLPELGEAKEGDRATQTEALLAAFEAIARAGVGAIALDDLQWADNASLEFMLGLADRLQEQPMLVVAIYRDDEIPRDHAIRRTRAELRRAHLLQEVTLKPLNQTQTAKLAERTLGEGLGPELTSVLYQRTLGVPMFVEELCGALVRAAALRRTEAGLELAEGQDMPLPETVRDAALMQVADLSGEARELLEIAAVAGQDFDPEVIRSLAGDDAGLEELFDQRIFVEQASGRMAFRQTLIRDAVYGEVAWTRRRELHRSMARRLEDEGAALRVVAEHYLAGRELDAARKTLIASAERSCELYAHRDAIASVEKALEIWPEGKDQELRLEALDILASCAELSGMPQRAARAWRESAGALHEEGDLEKSAEVNRKLAKVYEMQGAWDQAQAARMQAADAFAACDLPGEAAADRLAVASHLHSAASYETALTLTDALIEEAEAADRYDVLARGLGLEGALLAKTGEFERGRDSAQRGLSLALDHDETAAAAEVYQRLASVGEQASEYDAAVNAYQDAVRYCKQQDVDAMGNFCLACLSVVLRQVGDWEQAEDVCREVLDADEATDAGRAIASVILGLIEASRDRPDSARRLLSEADAIARFYDAVSIELTAAWGLAIVHDNEERPEAVKDRCRRILERWSGTDERHYAISPLRWAATWYAIQEDGGGARGCADALSKIAALGKPEALAGLAHALGEVALLEEDLTYAIEQFERALDILDDLEVPYDRAASRMRLGAALLADSQRTEGIDQLVQAHRSARDIGARDLTRVVGATLKRYGEPVDKHLGQRAAQRFEHGGLTKRQMEVLQLVAEGMTNREVADELVLSTRTVDMHVSNILSRLDSRSRTEAVKKAAELGLLGEG